MYCSPGCLMIHTSLRRQRSQLHDAVVHAHTVYHILRSRSVSNEMLCVCCSHICMGGVLRSASALS
jgi:hypothetical protein